MESKNKTIIIFENGSRIETFPAQDNIRGERSKLISVLGDDNNLYTFFDDNLIAINGIGVCE